MCIGDQKRFQRDCPFHAVKNNYIVKKLQFNQKIVKKYAQRILHFVQFIEV
jgi:hypothetical protein